MKGFLKCNCEHCQGHIEFPGSAIDTVIPCPHCGSMTTLRLEIPEDTEDDSDGTKAGRVFLISIIILVVAAAVIAGAYYYLKSKAAKKGGQKNVSSVSAPAIPEPQKTPPPPRVVDNIDPSQHLAPLEALRRLPTHEIKSGREVYLGHCSECHVFHDPAAYTSAEWAPLLNKMEGKAKLGRDERDRLERFMATIRTP